MKNSGISFISKKSEPVLYTEDIPEFFEKYKMPGGVDEIAYGSFGHFFFQEEQQADSLTSICYTNYLPSQNETFIFQSDQPNLRLQFAISNNFYFNEEGIGERELHEGNFNMFYVPFLKQEQTMRTGRIYGVFSIYFSPAYLDNWIHHYPALNDFIIKVFNNEPAILCDTDQITSLEMDVIIKQLIQNTFSGMARSIYMDLKIKELFMLVFDKVSNHPTVGHTCLSKNEIERFTEARDVLLQNIQNPMSLKQLSRKFGLNTKKIKNGFKQLYERTPFDLLLSTRMDKAKKMLTNSSMSITEIADEIGYDNKHSFSKAFKKYFGYPPGRFRKIDEESFCKYSTLDN